MANTDGDRLAGPERRWKSPPQMVSHLTCVLLVRNQGNFLPTKFIIRRNQQNVIDNDANGSRSSKTGTTSDRVESRAHLVVIQRNPYNDNGNSNGNIRLPTKNPLRIRTWNIRNLFKTGAARSLLSEVDKAKINIMGLQEVRWPGMGETICGSCTILWSGSADGKPRMADVALVLASYQWQIIVC